MATVLAISDLHCPYQHRDAFAFLNECKRKFKPDHIVCLGDEIDAAALSEHDHDPDADGPGPELDKAVEELQELYRIFPVGTSVESNHTSRIYRRAFKYGIPRSCLRDYRELLKAPRTWRWAESVVIDDVGYFHGDAYGSNSAEFHVRDTMRSAVCGHEHTSFKIVTKANERFLLYEVTAGCLINRKANAFKYCARRGRKPVIGTAVIIDGRPQLIALKMDRHGRWDGVV